MVRSRLKSRLRNRVEVSDVIQEVLIEIVRQFPSFTGDNEAALLGWIRRWLRISWRISVGFTNDGNAVVAYFRSPWIAC